MSDCELDNRMTADWWWGEREYGVPINRRLKRQRQAYEEEERGEREDERRR